MHLSIIQFLRSSLNQFILTLNITLAVIVTWFSKPKQTKGALGRWRKAIATCTLKQAVIGEIGGIRTAIRKQRQEVKKAHQNGAI